MYNEEVKENIDKKVSKSRKALLILAKTLGILFWVILLGAIYYIRITYWQ